MNIPLDPIAEVIQLKTPFKKPVPEDKFLIIDHSACNHYGASFVVDKTKTEVTCSRCKEKLNPMYVLEQLAYKETKWHETMARYQEEMQRLSERSKTRCQHCNLMTRISRA